MPRSGPRKVRRYSDEFKVTAVRLSQQPGMQVQTVAVLEIRLRRRRVADAQDERVPEMDQAKRGEQRVKVERCGDASPGSGRGRPCPVSPRFRA